MTFFGEEESNLELTFFGIFTGISLILLIPAIIFAKRNVRFGYFVWLTPIQCVIMAIENFMLALGENLDSDSSGVTFYLALHSLVVPLFLVISFDIAYMVHKNRSVNFFCISFDEGHRKRVEPHSWVMRNLMRMVAACLVAVNALVNYNVLGAAADAGRSGYLDWSAADPLEVTLSLLPGTVLAAFNLGIAFRLWLYGTQRALVIHATVWNEWILLFLGAMGQLAGLVAPTELYSVTSNAGEIFLLMCIIFIQYTIKKDFQLSNQFNLFLDAYDKVAAVQAPLQLLAGRPLSRGADLAGLGGGGGGGGGGDEEEGGNAPAAAPAAPPAGSPCSSSPAAPAPSPRPPLPPPARRGSAPGGGTRPATSSPQRVQGGAAAGAATGAAAAHDEERRQATPPQKRRAGKARPKKQNSASNLALSHQQSSSLLG